MQLTPSVLARTSGRPRVCPECHQPANVRHGDVTSVLDCSCISHRLAVHHMPWADRLKPGKACKWLC